MIDLRMLVPALVSLVLGGCLSGCSANHWLGDVAGRRPGVLVEKWGLFGGARFEVTSDCNASADEFSIESETPGESGDTRFAVRLIKPRFGQSASAVVKEEPAKIDAIARGQLTQVEYARVTWNGVRDLAREIMPIVGMFSGAFGSMTESAFNATFPGGFSLGKTKVTKPTEAANALAEMLARLKDADAAAEEATENTAAPVERGGAVPDGTQPTDKP